MPPFYKFIILIFVLDVIRKRLDTTTWLETTPFGAKFDADSAYYGSCFLKILIEMCGTSIQYSMNSLNFHNNSSTGSRWSISCNDILAHPMTIRGLEAGTISMNRLPNVKIIEGHFNAIPGHVLAIYITFVGIERIRKTNYLNLEEMAVVNTALNYASMGMKKLDDSSDHANDTKIRLPFFETKVRGAFSRFITNRKEHISPKSMLLFVQCVDDAFQYIFDKEDPEIFLSTEYTGMRFDEGDNGLDPRKFKEAILSLKRGMYFSASIAGMKEVFKEKPEFIQTFNTSDEDTYSRARWEQFVADAPQKAHDFLKEKVFVGATVGAENVYHFDLGLEVMPSFESRASFMVNMKYAKERMQEICSDQKLTDVYGHGLSEAHFIGDTRGHESVEEQNILDAGLQQVFEIGDFHTPDDIRGIPEFISNQIAGRIEENTEDGVAVENLEEDISRDDLFHEQRKLGINIFEKYLSNGNIGGVHTGSAPLRFIEVAGTDLMDFNDQYSIITKRKILPCRTLMEVCGGQIYDPAIMADFLTKQRKHIDDFAAIPNILSRILSSNPGSLDSNRSEIHETFLTLMNGLRHYIDDIKTRMNHSSQHSARFEIFFMSRLDGNITDMEFPTIDLKQFLSVVDHPFLVDALLYDFELNMKPLNVLAQQLIIIKSSTGDNIPSPEKLIPCVKTSLVCCSEVIVAMLDIRGFQGRIMKRLKREISPRGVAYEFFTIPEEYKVDLDGLDGIIDGLEFGLDPKLLKLPSVSCNSTACRQITNFIEIFLIIWRHASKLHVFH